MNTTTIVIVIVAWLSIGLLSGLWMARRGYDPLWVLVALPLGLLFLPIAVERVSRRPAVARSGAAGIRHPKSTTDGTTVLVGLDGSAESEQALATVLRLLGSSRALLVLVEVVHFEAIEKADRADLDAASGRLAAATARIGDNHAVHTEVLAGAPGPALRQFAREQDGDLLVIGRRGRGLSRHLLGSVSADLVENSSVPVLVVGRTREHFSVP
ncbi:universal stress protein [Mycolicibacterium litorale]|uniref:UspA domain-containing protein n=1 Tax=Mycolicibacterium litorale TaxID=758802 RepID=A0AAD1MSS6_9MYCO|nr:universal stress protein [Mycolicibacterium litorale]MCV7416276.1 universal stress protein [Mycolicibacterium litorale]TDY09529.1 nucleotide-binding universal stress UspA family protein [Mycolicibacterium litorale]BBY17474.1 hypothetical protein MLIT_30660 [Mycolicibacterium litorale]